jgi:hypothetical protein
MIRLLEALGTRFVGNWVDLRARVRYLAQVYRGDVALEGLVFAEDLIAWWISRALSVTELAGFVVTEGDKRVWVRQDFKGLGGKLPGISRALHGWQYGSLT